MHTITKFIAIFVTATLVLNAMAPMLAHAAKHLQGDQVNANALVRDAYIAITYRDGNDRERTARGWIDAIGETSFTIRSGGLKSKTTIAYAKVLSIIMSEESSVPATQMNEVNRFIRDQKRSAAKAEQKAKTEVIHLQGEQVKADTLIQNAYAVVTYYEDNKLKQEKAGIIKAIGDTSFTIQNGILGKTTIAYAKVMTLVMSADTGVYLTQRNAVARETKKIEAETKAIQRFMTHNAKVRFKVPSLTKEWIVGEVVKMTQDTLLIREGRTLSTRAAVIKMAILQVPMSSISNFEASIGQRRNAGKGFMIGLGLGLAVLVPVAIADYKEGGEFELHGWATAITAAYIFPSIVILSTLMGAATKSENWVEVPPQRLNLSIAPTPEKGLRAALTVNF